MAVQNTRPSTLPQAHSGLAERFQIVTTRVSVAGFELDLAHPASADDLIDEVEFNRDERLPYWADIWPSARVLARHIAGSEGRGRRLLDLGCGVGLAALAAARGGYQVVASDYYFAALEFVELNAERNGLSGIETRMIDFRSLPDDSGRFDVVAAADVLYERAYARHIAHAFARLLKPGGVGFLTDPDRRSADPFAQECQRRGLEAKRVATSV